MQWYYAIADQRLGPVSHAELERLIEKGSLIGRSLVWRKGMDQWETLDAVISARAKAVSGLQAASANPADPEAMKGLVQAEGMLSGALGRLLAVAEAYPDLKANQNMMQLSEELTSTENKVSFARQAYNDAVMAFNNAVETFPNSIIAGMFNFKQAEFFEVEAPAEREAPKVSFS